MWSNHTKIFVFRDCLDEGIVTGNVTAINKLLSLEQSDKNYGALITTDILSVSTISDGILAFKTEDEGEWNLQFFKGENEIASVSLWDQKEIHLCFEIEEEVETGEFKIHYCTIKGFKEYQM